jgi:hypothetical protein
MTTQKPSLIGISGRAGSGKDTVGAIVQYLLHVDKEEKASRVPAQGLSVFLATKGSLTYTDWQVKKFAGKLKQIASLLTGIPVEKFEDQEFKNSELGQEWEQELGMEGMFPQPYTRKPTVRLFLQLLGTEAIRDGLHPNSWVNALFADYKLVTKISYAKKKSEVIWEVPEDPSIPEYFHGRFLSDEKFSWEEEPNWVITDLRFPNEFEAIKSRGGLCIIVHRYPTEVIRDRGGEDITSEPFDSSNEEHMKLYKCGVHLSETALDSHTFDYVLNNSGTIDDLVEEVRKMLVHFKLLEL